MRGRARSRRGGPLISRCRIEEEVSSGASTTNECPILPTAQSFWAPPPRFHSFRDLPLRCPGARSSQNIARTHSTGVRNCAEFYTSRQTDVSRRHLFILPHVSHALSPVVRYPRLCASKVLFNIDPLPSLLLSGYLHRVVFSALPVL